VATKEEMMAAFEVVFGTKLAPRMYSAWLKNKQSNRMELNGEDGGEEK